MPINRISSIPLSSRNSIYPVSANSYASPSQIYDAFNKVDIEIDEKQVASWAKGLESKFNESENYPGKESSLYELRELYRVSKSKAARKPLRRIYKKEENERLRRKAGKTLGYSKLRIDLSSYYNENKKAIVASAIIISIITAETIYNKLCN